MTMLAVVINNIKTLIAIMRMIMMGRMMVMAMMIMAMVTVTITKRIII